MTITTLAALKAAIAKFDPTQSGAADACKLLGCSYQWTGSQNSNIGEMTNAFNSAVSAGGSVTLDAPGGNVTLDQGATVTAGSPIAARAPLVHAAHASSTTRRVPSAMGQWPRAPRLPGRWPRNRALL